MGAVPKQFKPYLFKKGQSGNPHGRPKGKTMKEFAREYLLTMSDEEKIKFMNSLNPEVIWKMAEGNPHQTEDVTSDGKAVQPILVRFLENGEDHRNSEGV